MQRGNGLIGFVLPDSKDGRDITADYFDCLAPDGQTLRNRDDIIGNCENSFSAVIRAFEMAQSLRSVEQLIFVAFIYDFWKQN